MHYPHRIMRQPARPRRRRTGPGWSGRAAAGLEGIAEGHEFIDFGDDAIARGHVTLDDDGTGGKRHFTPDLLHGIPAGFLDGRSAQQFKRSFSIEYNFMFYKYFYNTLIIFFKTDYCQFLYLGKRDFAYCALNDFRKCVCIRPRF